MTGELADQSIGIVGAGFGGLAASAYLARDGADVTVYEKRSQVGGVAGRIQDDGFQFDTGPSWYLMPEIFERFFEAFGHAPSDYYELTRLDPNYRVFWTDGDRADVPADPQQAAELFESYETGGGDALLEYLDQAERAYDIGLNRFVIPGRSRFRDYLSLDVMRSTHGLQLLGTMDDHVSDYFDHPKLRQLVEYTLVFLGGSPYNTPALYTLMSHVDYGLGVYYPTGGIAAVVDGVEAVAKEQGVEIRTDTPVSRIEPGDDEVRVEHSDGTATHDRVVSNAPPAHTERELFPDGAVDRSSDHWDDATLAPSAYMLYLGVEGDLDPLEHHSLVLPVDWDDHFDSIFESPRWPDKPAYYVNVPSKTDPTVAPDGCETVVVLVPMAPGLDGDDERADRFRDKILEDIAENTGVDLRDRIRVEHRATVSDFERKFNKPRGTALGVAHTLWQTGPLRDGNRVPGTDRCYYVGGDVNPGIGVPMCLLSGEHVADAIREDTEESALLGLLS